LAEITSEPRFFIRIFQTRPGSRATGFRVNHRLLRAAAQRVMSGENRFFAIHLILTDDRELRRLHRTFFGGNETSDVVTFPAESAGEISEIYVNLEQARRQALEDGIPLQHAVERLLIHGILHLTGMRDDTEPRRRRMLDLGERYLRAGHPAGQTPPH
jgi:probable rRNA maturation factor